MLISDALLAFGLLTVAASGLASLVTWPRDRRTREIILAAGALLVVAAMFVQILESN